MELEWGVLGEVGSEAGLHFGAGTGEGNGKKPGE